MTRLTLDEVLDCPALPTLPAVALKILDLTNDAEVRIDDIARAVQNDPALTGKILRTVNSSYYALSEPCLTVSRALTYLGISTVRSLVLGFSLIEMGRERSGGVDQAALWQRCLFAAAAARRFASTCRLGDPEEGFVGALMQDVGMLALHATNTDLYSAVLLEAAGDHRKLPGIEQETLGFDHAFVGGMLAERWGLPPELVAGIRHHHDLEAASHGRLSRLVAIGCEAATSLVQRDPAVAMTQVYLLANEWFGCRRSDVTQLMRSINSDAKELSTLFEVSPRVPIDVEQILADAEERLRELADTEEKVDETSAATTDLAALADVLPDCFEQAEAFNGSLAVIDIGVDDFESTVAAHGAEHRSALRRAIEHRIRQAMRSADRLCLGESDRFLLVLPGADLREAATRAEIIRNAVNEHGFTEIADEALALTCSLGVAARTPGTAAVFMAPVILLEAASRARRAARDGGGNAARVFTPAARAA